MMVALEGLKIIFVSTNIVTYYEKRQAILERERI